MKTSIDEAAKKTMQKTGKGFFFVVLVMMSMLFIVCQVAIAQNEAGQTDENVQAQPKNLNDYFRGKYKFRGTDIVMSTVRRTPYGPKGHLGLSGHIKMSNVQAAPGEHGLERAIARAFLEEEAVLLGITDMNEFREDKVYKSDLNITYVLYRRYINNLKLEEVYIDIAIGTDETIRSVDATLVPVSPEAYEASTKKTLPESRVREIVLRDLRSSGDDQHLGKVQKYVIDEPPYVIWDIMSRWHYRVDAFTGEILRKTTTQIGTY
jgi:hypothetical protein